MVNSRALTKDYAVERTAGDIYKSTHTVTLATCCTSDCHDLLFKRSAENQEKNKLAT